MTPDPHTLAFGPKHCSLEPTLGDYYQDLSSAIELVEGGYHGGLDDRGVPLVRYGDEGWFYNAVVTAQYALANNSAVLGGDESRVERLCVQLDWLVKAQEQEGAFAGCWTMNHDNNKYRWLKAPWTSALASGNAISALLRGWELLGDERYRAAATLAYNAMHDPATNLAVVNADELWYEEYPAQQPLHVFNGHVYALLGVLDYARFTGDAEAAARWRRATATVLSHLPRFDLGYWSSYDLRWREPVSLHYQKNIHVPQLRILGTLSGDAPFSETADRWQGYADSSVSRARWQVALRMHRWRKGSGTMMLPGDADDVVKRSSATPSQSAAQPGIALRRFPYPYRAALAICNDADLLTPSDFRRLHRFLSSDEDTDWGPGLSLSLGGTFFMFRSPTSPNVFTVFDRMSTTITDDGEQILEWAKEGVLDALHTYGCFTDPTHFTRGLAERAIETLRTRGIQIETWVNHGPPTNVQCIGLQDSWQGDAVGTPGYHADLTTDYGIRWFWTGVEMTDHIALDAARRPSPVSSGLQDLKRRLQGTPDHHGELVEPLTLRDGRRVRSLCRYSGMSGRTPVLADLPAQLSAANLEALVNAGGYAIVYQHLSVRRIRPGSGTGAYRPVDEAWFAPAELAALRRLAERHHEGDIWVAPTTSLLRYRDAFRGLSWSSRDTTDGNVIVISGPVRREALVGMTFYTDRPDATRIAVEDADGSERMVPTRVNPPDESSRRSISIVEREVDDAR